MGKLIISRRKEWQNRGRKFKIFVDGENMDLVENGQIKELEIDAGKHKIQFKVDWCSSPELELEILDEKSKTLEVSGYKWGKWVMSIMYILFGAFFLIKIFFEREIKELIIAMLPFFLVFLYYLTFGRKKYIEVSEL